MNDWGDMTAGGWGNLHVNSAPTYRNTYAYDPTGNRILTIKDGARTTSTFDPANQNAYSLDANGRTTYTFDASGNRTGVEKPDGSRTTTSYDFENRDILVQLPTGLRNTMAYDPNGLRVLLEDSSGTSSIPSVRVGTSQTGLYENGGNSLGLVASGIEQWRVGSGGGLVGVGGSGAVLPLPGSASAPGVTRLGDRNTGVYWPSADVLAITTGGAERARISSDGLDISADTIRLREAKTPSSAADIGNQGDLCWDDDYVYICVATNTWTPLRRLTTCADNSCKTHLSAMLLKQACRCVVRRELAGSTDLVVTYSRLFAPLFLEIQVLLIAVGCCRRYNTANSQSTTDRSHSPPQNGGLSSPTSRSVIRL